MGDTINVTGVQGTTEANGTWVVSAYTLTTITLAGSAYANVYASGGSGSYVGLTASTTGHVTNSLSGVEVQSGAQTNTLVGLAYIDGTPSFHDVTTKRDVASWYNRRPKQCINKFTTSDKTTTSTTYTEIDTSIECEFVVWANPPGPDSPNLTWSASGEVGSSVPVAGDGAATSVGFDGSSTAQTEQVALVSNNATTQFPFGLTGASSGTSGLAEGKHTITLLGKAVTGGTATWYQAYTSLEADPWQ